eukprot:1147744-Pelagomonas_calceolata.AAC.5
MRRGHKQLHSPGNLQREGADARGEGGRQANVLACEHSSRGALSLPKQTWFRCYRDGSAALLPKARPSRTAALSPTHQPITLAAGPIKKGCSCLESVRGWLMGMRAPQQLFQI